MITCRSIKEHLFLVGKKNFARALSPFFSESSRHDRILVLRHSSSLHNGRDSIFLRCLLRPTRRIVAVSNRPGDGSSPEPLSALMKQRSSAATALALVRSSALRGAGDLAACKAAGEKLFPDPLSAVEDGLYAAPSGAAAGSPA